MRPEDPPGSVPPGSVAAWSTDGGARLDEDARGAERYSRGGELGRGGMGVVAASVDTWLDRSVAIKRPIVGRGGNHAARVAHEARITARLVHPAIPPIYDVGEDDEGPYYTMPVLVGATLHERVAARDTSLRALVDAVATACRAAGYAHARGVVHRDLKPSNVLLGAHGELWVLDWGVAFDPAHPDAAAVGTPGFQAPELLARQAVTPAADVFSLGVTLAEVLDAQPEPQPELRSIVERATRTDPRARYAEGAALAEELDHWLDGRLVEAHAYPSREVLWRLVVRWRAPLVVAAGALVVVGALGVVALRAQAAERARADHSLSTSLAQQAAALVLHGARPEATVLAAHALAIEESPLARGVLMAWSASPPVSLAGTSAPPCVGAFVEPDGHVICAGDRLRLFAPDGHERWSAALVTPARASGEWVGEVVAARRYDGDVVVLRRSSNHVEVWRDGARVVVLKRGAPTSLGLADGPVPALFDAQRVGLLNVRTGEVAWGPPTCDRIEGALVRQDALLVGCREPTAFVGTVDQPGPPIPLVGSASALAWHDGPWIGTFEGDLLTRDGDAWSAFDAHVGAVRQLLPLGAGRAVLVGERGRARIVSPRERVVLDTLPQGVRAVVVTTDGLQTWGGSTRRYVVDPALVPVVFDRAAEGGIATFDVSSTGDALAAGSASGEVVTWTARTGAATQHAAPGANAAKAVRFLDDHTIVHAESPSGVRRVPLDGAPPSALTTAVARAAAAYEGGMAVLPWSPWVALVGETERRVPLPTRPLAATVSGTLWVTDERGGVHELTGDTFTRRFDLPTSTSALAATGDLLITPDGADVVARTHDGAERWRWRGAAAITAVDASDAWVAAGDAEGRVLLFKPDGGLVARITGHTRRVSSVVLRGDRLYSASWDGLARVWSLDDAELDGAAWVDRATRTWGLSLAEALVGADAAGAAE